MSDKKTIIQINIEVPKIFGYALNESVKFAKGGLELLRFGERFVSKNNDNNKQSSLKKINIK